MLIVKANQKTLRHQIRSQFQRKSKNLFMETNHEFSHSRDITWTLRAKSTPEHILEAWIGNN